MAFDIHREMKIEYGKLNNLPLLIGWRNGFMENHYTYDGQKLGKKVYDSRGNLTLNESYFDELMLSHRQPSRISHADGYVSLDENGDATFFYYLKDHLGNVRSVLTPDTDGKPQVEQANDYFPFGMSFESRLPYLTKSGSTRNNFKYNGKEEQEMPGKWLDYGARYYDPALGRFHTLDPLAETYSYQSPFVYAANNPIRFIDFMGMSASPYYDENGNFLGIDENGFAGEIFVTNQKTFEANSSDGVANSETIQEDENTESIGTANLSDKALSNVYTDVITKMDEVSSDELYNGQVSIFNGTGSWDYENGSMNYGGHNKPDHYPVFGHSDTEDGKHKITVGPDGRSEITTVENAQNALGVHEFVAHGKKGVPGGATKGHARAYEMQQAHPTWKNTTPQFKKAMMDRYNEYLNY